MKSLIHSGKENRREIRGGEFVELYYCKSRYDLRLLGYNEDKKEKGHEPDPVYLRPYVLIK